MHLNLTGRNAIIAGGLRGIGRSIALAFARAGANVSICARGEAALRATEKELVSCGPAPHTVHAASCDLADGAAVARYIETAAQALGGIDILVNNASGFGLSDDEAGWAASINVDLLAPVRASRAALPYLEKSQGSIIHISSLFSPYERSHFSEGKYFGLFFEVPTMPPYETRDLNIGKASEFLLVFIEAE